MCGGPSARSAERVHVNGRCSLLRRIVGDGFFAWLSRLAYRAAPVEIFDDLDAEELLAGQEGYSVFVPSLEASGVPLVITWSSHSFHDLGGCVGQGFSPQGFVMISTDGEFCAICSVSWCAELRPRAAAVRRARGGLVEWSQFCGDARATRKPRMHVNPSSMRPNARELVGQPA